METFDLNCFNKKELVRLFLYKTFDTLLNYGINDIIFNSGIISKSINSYGSVSSLSKDLVKLNISSIIISTDFGVSYIDVVNIYGFAIFDNFIELNTRNKKFIFFKE